MNFGFLGRLADNLHGFNVGLWTESKDFSITSNSLFYIWVGDFANIWLEDINCQTMLFFESFNDRFQLFMNGFLNTSICKLEDDIIIIFVLSDIHQKFVYILLVIH